VKLDSFGGLLKYNIFVECVCESGLLGGCYGIIILLWSVCVKLDCFGGLFNYK
jgi:hypothetical protein